ncbi:DUF4105 domain-containing protein [uncultured Muribaculum sp.]|uniref:lipoprotein N-acyltransferase Lnb domain-containing protein n=1 Tax=uncultured Muribaculum sp. TaxID=1918613 RepID=UPI0025E4415D|nr:DUF4105 domain-containing protein [uncultured Muribaculum sp.]
MKGIITLLISIVVAALSVVAQPSADSVRVSLVVCSPGSAVYELEGHAALRVVFPDGRDMAVNYGIFDFDSPNFIYRFVKGETDYMVAAYPFAYFLESYRRDGREVVEYPLRLTSGESSKLLEMLQSNLLPENRVYRYNYVKDNCATRPLRIVEAAVGDTLSLQAPPYTAGWTFRDAMRHYHRNYPWYQFGIDLALGSGIDYPLSDHEKVFAPDMLRLMLSGAVVADSAGERRIMVDELVEYGPVRSGGGPLGPTPWPLTPLAVSFYILIAVLICALYDLRRRHVSRWADAIYMTAAGLAGCLVAFLVLVSTHEATSPNWLIVWLNPLCFIVPACIFIKKYARLLFCYEILNFVALFLLCMLWPLTGQVANVAFWPLIAADMVLSARYIYIYASCAKKSIQA